MSKYRVVRKSDEDYHAQEYISAIDKWHTMCPDGAYATFYTKGAAIRYIQDFQHGVKEEVVWESE
jgi:hypothetical protein